MDEYKLQHAFRNMNIKPDMENRLIAALKARQDAGAEVLCIPPRRRFRVRKGVLIAAAVLVALIVTAAATSGLWTPKLAEIFGADEEMQEELTALGATEIVDVSSSDNGLTVTAVQAIGDKYCVYILLKIESDDPTLLHDGIRLDYDFVVDGGETYGHNVTSDWPDGTFEEGVNYDTVYYGLCIDGDYETGLSGHTLTLDVTGITETDEDSEQPANDDITLWSGDIQLEWTLSFNDDTSILYEVHHPFTSGDMTFYIDSIEISPLSVTLNYNIDSVNSAIEAGVYFPPSCGYPYSLTCSDGSTVSLHCGGTARSDYKDDDIYGELLGYRMTFVPGGIIDVNDVVTVSLDGPKVDGERVLNDIPLE